jgi:hypothetical protein
MFRTEDQIEREVERRMDALDRRLMRGALTQAAYDEAIRALDAWSRAQGRALPGGRR